MTGAQNARRRPAWTPGGGESRGAGDTQSLPRPARKLAVLDGLILTERERAAYESGATWGISRGLELAEETLRREWEPLREHAQRLAARMGTDAVLPGVADDAEVVA